MELVRAIPEAMSRALDLVVKAIDAPDMDKLAERLRPPDIQEDQDGEDVDPRQRQLQQQQMLAQQGELIKELTAHVNELSETVKNKRLELESRERIATQTNLAKLLEAEAFGRGQIAQTLLKQDHDTFIHQVDKRMELLHMDQTVETDSLDRAAVTEQRKADQETAQAEAKAKAKAPAAAKRSRRRKSRPLIVRISLSESGMAGLNPHLAIFIERATSTRRS